MREPRPSKWKPPVWAMREFRWLLIAGIMGVSILAVLIFEVGPKSRKPAGFDVPLDPAALAPADWAAPAPVALEGVRDRGPVDAKDPAHAALVRHVAQAPAAAGKTVDYRLFGAAPERARGRDVKISALYLDTSPLRAEPEAGVEWIHRTYLSDLSTREGYVVDLLEPPAGFERRDVAEVSAAFLKLVSYEGRRGPVTAPLFVGRALRKIDERAVLAATPDLTPWILGVAGVSLGAVAVLSVRLWRRRKSGRGIPPWRPPVSGSQVGS